MFEKKFLILTCNLNNRDKLQDPPIKFSDCDYIAITDKIDKNIKIWRQILSQYFCFDEGKYNHRMIARAYKVNPFQFFKQLNLDKYDYLVWHDARIDLFIHPMNFLKISGCLDSYLYFIKHPCHLTLNEEINSIIDLKFEYDEKIKKIQKFISSIDLKKDIPIIATGFFIRNLNKDNLGFDQLWWQLICKYSSRDQLTLPVALQESKVDFFVFDFNIWDNPYFLVKKHND